MFQTSAKKLIDIQFLSINFFDKNNETDLHHQ